ncbi:MAG TPA: inner membrane CreD family protein [Candidatus Eremiobacteraceae bacterium]|nr:inner membrane CreD family protein [Candidatus Eremiobacteraceae bacterium]
MVKHLIALLVILLGATASWMILGGTLYDRTNQATTEEQTEIQSLWGPDNKQVAPTVTYAARKSTRQLALDASTIDVNLALEERRKGLLYFNAYRVDFAGTYTITNSSNAHLLVFSLPLPAQDGVYDDVRLSVDGRPTSASIENNAIIGAISVPPGQAIEVLAAYRTQGSGQWLYDFGDGVNSVHDFDLTMHTNFAAIDFPAATLSPTSEQQSASGWRLEWRYKNLITGHDIGMVAPEPMQPGPLAQRITFWAPLSLLFYFFVMVILTTVRRIDLHAMNYFFLAASFFAFHLLFAWTVDRLSIGAAFALCSVVSMTMTITYLRLVVGLRFAAVEAGLAQLFYLILFSLALFNEGFSGLVVTVGAIITLYLSMLVTARLNWHQVFQTKPVVAE